MEFHSTLEGSRSGLRSSGGAGAKTMAKFDPVLLGLGQAGDDGERLVVDQYRHRVRRFFQKKGAAPEEARDLTQDTFLRVFRGEARLESREQLEAWLFEIARNVWSNALRAESTLKRSASVVSLDEPLSEEGGPRDVADPAFTDGEQDALTRVITREQLQILHRGLAELPDQMRQCMRLRYQGLKYREIAEVMRISIETVKSHLHDAKKRLRPLLEPHFGPIDI